MRTLDIYERFFLYNLIEKGVFNDGDLNKNPNYLDITKYISRHVFGEVTHNEIHEWLDGKNIPLYTAWPNILIKDFDTVRCFQITTGGNLNASSYLLMKELAWKMLDGKITRKGNCIEFITRKQRNHDETLIPEPITTMYKPGDIGILINDEWYQFAVKPIEGDEA